MLGEKLIDDASAAQFRVVVSIATDAVHKPSVRGLNVDGQEDQSVPATSHVELAIRLLRDAAGFFRNVGEQNHSLKSEMFDNADVYDQVADLLEDDPAGLVELEED